MQIELHASIYGNLLVRLTCSYTKYEQLCTTMLFVHVDAMKNR